MKAFGWKTLAWRGGAVAAALAGAMMTGTASAQALRTEGGSTFVAVRDEVRVPAPPDRPATEAELAELKRLTAERSAAGAERAAYWATGGSAYRWNAVAADEMILRGIPTPVAARHMALVHAAVHDAVVIAFEQKSVHNRARPIDQDKELKTSLATPSSPSYPSEHAAAAGAASEVLAYLFPDKADAFRAMADEAGRSRSMAGVAFPSDVAAGLALGRSVGGKAVERGKADRLRREMDRLGPNDARFLDRQQCHPASRGNLEDLAHHLRRRSPSCPPTSVRLAPEKSRARRAQSHPAYPGDDEPRLVLGMGRRRISCLASLERADEPEGVGIWAG